MAEIPKIGEIIDGYRFKGGDPASPGSWVKEEPKDLTAAEAAFPRATKAPTMGRKAAGRLADILTFLQRASSASDYPMVDPMEQKIGIRPKPPPQDQQDFRRRMAETRGKGMLEDALKSPAAIPVAATIPFTAGLGAGPYLAAGIEGVAGAGALEAERFAEKGRVSPKAAAGEVAFNMAFPLGGAALKKVGQGLIRPILKPKDVVKRQLNKKNINLGKDFMGDVFGQKVASPVPGMGGLKQVKQRALDAERATNAKFKQVLDANSHVDIDVREAYHTAVDKLNEEMSRGKHFDVSDKIQKAIDKWGKKITKEGKGFVKLPEAIELRKSLDDAAKWEYVSDADPKLVAEARVARAIRRALNETQIHAKVPDIIQVDRILSHGYPIQSAIEDAYERIENNRGISLTDIILVSGGIGGMAAGEIGGIPGASETSVAAMGLMLLNRMLRSSTVATGLYRSGQALQTPARQLLIRPISSGAMREQAIQRAAGQQGNE